MLLLVALGICCCQEASAADHLRQQQQKDVVSLQESRRVNMVPAYNQEIRGGFEVEEVLPWYLVFADTTICGGALVSCCTAYGTIL